MRRPGQPARRQARSGWSFARERVLGPDHPDTLTSRDNLAVAYRSVGRLAEAIELFERTLSGCERVLGADHPTTRTVASNLAVAQENGNSAY